MIVVVDYGVGNLGSIINMFKRIGQKVVRSGDREVMSAADRILLPGVGAYDAALEKLDRLDLIGPLTELAIEKKKPILGICLGMQIMGNSSEEGERRGLGWIDGDVVKFTFSPEQKIKVPHMAWNYATPSKDHHITKSMGEDDRFYFIHSYHFSCSHSEDVLMTAHYGGNEFTAGIARNNIAAVQFHPEKSHRYGMEFLRQFSNWEPETSSNG